MSTVEIATNTFRVSFSVMIRPCVAADIEKIERAGMERGTLPHLHLAFAAHQAGQITMLVADANDFPVGRIHATARERNGRRVGYVSNLGVLAGLRQQGIGTWLIREAERVLRAQGLTILEICVGKDNPDAHRLYTRLGYCIIGDDVDRYDYEMDGGETIVVADPVWIMEKEI